MSASVLTGNPVRDSAVTTDKSLLLPEGTVFMDRVSFTTSVNRTLFNNTLKEKLDAQS